MAPPLRLRTALILRLCLLHHRTSGSISTTQRLLCSSSSNSKATDLPAGCETTKSPTLSQIFSSSKTYGRQLRCDDADYWRWKDKEAEILEDIEPTVRLAKEILHSDRYMDGARLTPDDEKAVVDKLLSHHPHSEDKVGCGLDSIMVDRHPQFGNSRCLFVVRTDGGLIDFSYLKCLRAYVRDKYPSSADRFIKEHFKRSTSRQDV